ncbi:MAG: hypothetical protein V2I82_11595 [Halieaceae bacterium]|jgi:hypothetical protein|nr:hypothetical protein [Halieaceae bacterium]
MTRRDSTRNWSLASLLACFVAMQSLLSLHVHAADADAQHQGLFLDCVVCQLAAGSDTDAAHAGCGILWPSLHGHVLPAPGTAAALAQRPASAMGPRAPPALLQAPGIPRA